MSISSFFRLARLPWPVDRDQLDDAYYRFPSHIGDRAFEACVFLDKAFPASHDVEFVDVHNNVSWLCGFKLGMAIDELADMMQTSPWIPFQRTMVSRSMMPMRVRNQYIRILRLGITWPWWVGSDKLLAWQSHHFA